MKKYISLILILMLITGLLSGCGSQTVESQIREEEAADSDSVDRMEESPVIEYTVPKSVPSILVDQQGYLQDRTKMAIFLGDEVSPYFTVCDAATGETVYVGALEEKGTDEKSGKTIYYGDFTDYMKDGTFFVHHDQLGSSYSFRVGNESYHDLLKRVYEKLSAFEEGQDTSEETSGGWITGDKERRGTVDNCKAALTLMMAYELYPSAVEILNGNTSSSDSVPPVILQNMLSQISFLSKLQDTATGGVCAGVLKRPSGKDYAFVKEETDYEATAYFIAVMAGFGYLYQKYDYNIAKGCLQGANRAWKYLNKNVNEVDPSDYYMAAAQMYRTTGTYSYRKVVEAYEEHMLSDELEGSFLYGSYFYLITKSKVNIDICSELTKRFMNRAEQIAGNIQSSRFLTETGLDEEGLESMLQDMQTMVIVNYTIPNYEYATVIENQLHYVLGRNESAICLMAGEGDSSVQETDAINIGAKPMRIAQACALISEVIGQMKEAEMNR